MHLQPENLRLVAHLKTYGKFSPMRRDVWLSREARWHVVAREGDSETGRVLRWEFATEAQARAMVERLLAAETGQTWRERDGSAATSPRPG